MKWVLALAPIVSMEIAMAACGTGAPARSGVGSARVASAAVPAGGDGDRDREGEKDDSAVLSYGRMASPTEKRIVANVVRRYYAAAARADGGAVCSLMYSTLADAMPEDYGSGAGPAYLRGARTCQAVASRLFRHSPSELPRLIDVTEVRVKGQAGFVFLRSNTSTSLYMPIRREGQTWKVNALLANPFT